MIASLGVALGCFSDPTWPAAAPTEVVGLDDEATLLLAPGEAASIALELTSATVATMAFSVVVPGEASHLTGGRIVRLEVSPPSGDGFVEVVRTPSLGGEYRGPFQWDAGRTLITFLSAPTNEKLLEVRVSVSTAPPPGA